MEKNYEEELNQKFRFKEYSEGTPGDHSGYDKDHLPTYKFNLNDEEMIALSRRVLSHK